MNQKTPSITAYIGVYVALLVLLIITVGVAFFDLGRFNLAAAVGIAMIKALLIILYFMHVKTGSSLMKLFAAAGFLWVVIMFLLTLSDYLARRIVTG